MTPESLLDTLLANGPYVRAGAPFRLLEVTGPDAGEFLHRLCSQDVLGLADGQGLPAAFLDAKGKLQVTCLVGRLGDGFLLEVPEASAERLATLLERYHFTERLTIGVRAAVGPVERVAVGAGGPATARVVATAAGIEVIVDRAGIRFVRRYGEVDADGGRPLDPDRASALRLLAGLVAVGLETEPTTLVLEAGLDDHCSSSKGCYTGQEIVARIHTYGHVNRRLCLLQLPAGEAITAPVPLLDHDELPVGRVMHAVPLPDGLGRLGAGFLPQDFLAPGTALRLADGGAVTVLRPLQPLPA